MEIILAALAEAIFGVLIEDLAQQPRLVALREKLRGDSPEKLALRRALAEAYAEFTRSYSELAASFFDEFFLSTREVVAELAKLLTPNRTPDTQTLEQLWRAQFRFKPVVDLTPAIAFFLRALETSVKSKPDLKPFVDSRAFQELYAITEYSRQEVELQGETLRLMRDLARSNEAFQQRILGTLVPTVARSIAMSLPAPDDPPPALSLVAKREALISEIDRKLAQVTWLALVGGPEIGKTQLARALAEASECPNRWWVSLGGNHSFHNDSHLEQQIRCWLEHLAPNESPLGSRAMHGLSLAEVGQRIAEVVTDRGLLVIDDLPDPIDSPAPYRVLASIARTFHAYGTKILTTSQRAVPHDIEVVLGTTLSSINPPPFSDTDVLELLERAGAPKWAQDKRIVSVIHATTGGHASLVSGTVLWWKQRGWRFKKEEREALLLGSAGDSVRTEARRSLSRLLTETCRQLLYRVSLLGDPFPAVLIDKVANITPRISLVGECLDELTGVWLEQRSAGQYSVTPLLQNAGIPNLTKATLKAVHATAAEWYLSMKEVTPEQALRIAGHLRLADENQRLVWLLIQLMFAAQTPAQAKYVDWATELLGPDMDWPSDLSLDLKIILRATQVRTAALAGNNTDELNADLETLLSNEIHGNEMAFLFAYVTAGALVSELPPVVQLQRTAKAIHLLAREPLLSLEAFPGPVEEMLWFSSVHLRGAQQVREFLHVVQQLSDEERTRLFESRLAIEAVSLMLDRVWDTESRKALNEQDWTDILRFFDEVKDVASLIGALPMQVAEVRARAIVLADHLGQPLEAIGVLQSVPDPIDADLRRLLRYTIGCILFATQEYAKSLEPLEDATGKSDRFPIDHFDALRRLGIAQARLGASENARRQCSKAIQAARGYSEALTCDIAEIFGELAWLQWEAGNRKRALGAMHGYAVTLLSQWNPEEPRFREAYNKALHALGWLNTVAVKGQPPATTQDGEKYVAPESGFFGLRRAQMADFTSEVGFSRAMLLAQIASLATSTGLPRIAYHLYIMADSTISEDDAATALIMELVERAPLIARFGSFIDALKAAIGSIQGLAALQPLSSKRLSGLTVKRMRELIASHWSSISKEERNKAESALLYLVFAPAFLDLLAADLPQDIARPKAENWHATIRAHLGDFEDASFWDEVGRYMSQLVKCWYNDSPMCTSLSIPHDHPLLKALWYLVSSARPSTPLLQAFQMQVYALDHLMTTLHVGKHALPSMGIILRRFWAGIACTRGFAVRHPSIFLEELSHISIEQNGRTAIRTLKSAARALGIAIPQEIRDRFTAVENPGV